jgi:hypothetical protein
MSAADIAEVKEEIRVLKQEIINCQNVLNSEVEAVVPEARGELLIQRLIGLEARLTGLEAQLTGLQARRERLEQQQAAAGKFLFIYFHRGYFVYKSFSLELNGKQFPFSLRLKYLILYTTLFVYSHAFYYVFFFILPDFANYFLANPINGAPDTRKSFIHLLIISLANICI